MVQTGDSIMLFQAFSYDFKEELPVIVGNCVEVSKTPVAFLRRVQPRALVDYVLPGFSLPGYTYPQACLRVTSTANSTGFPADTLLWLAILGLRLRLPLPIHISGSFVVKDHQHILDDFRLIYARSTWTFGTKRRYSGADLRIAHAINLRIFGVAPLAQRLSTAVVLFSQASCGNVQSLQSASLCLFAALEALFGSKKIYNGNELGPLIGNALRNLSFPFDVSSWVKDEFNGRRNDLAHGVQDVLP